MRPDTMAGPEELEVLRHEPEPGYALALWVVYLSAMFYLLFIYLKVS
jgi:hypothetical protein